MRLVSQDLLLFSLLLIKGLIICSAILPVEERSNEHVIRHTYDRDGQLVEKYKGTGKWWDSKKKERNIHVIMDKDIIKRLEKFFLEEPIARGIETPTSKLYEVAQTLGVELDEQYKLFQTLFGGSVIGTIEVVGISGYNSTMLDDYDVVELTQEFRETFNTQGIVIGVDYDGSYFVLSPSGEILLFSDEGNCPIVYAPNLESYIQKALAEIDIVE